MEVLPLAVTMVAGPVMMAAIVFVTHPRAVPVSLSFLAGVAIGVVVGVAGALGLASLVGESTSLGDSSDAGSTGTVIQLVLVGLLIAACVRLYLGRAQAKPPKWLGGAMGATVGKAFVIGLLVILLGPSDIVVMLTVGTNLESGGASLAEAVPFMVATVALTALPLLAYLLFRSGAERAMPAAREWMGTHSWLVNIFVLCVFILLILG